MFNVPLAMSHYVQLLGVVPESQDVVQAYVKTLSVKKEKSIQENAMKLCEKQSSASAKSRYHTINMSK